mgnify:CR=1 FL=1
MASSKRNMSFHQARVVMAVVDLSFPVIGRQLPIDHGYALYGAICRALGPLLHDRDAVGIVPIPGLRATPATLSISERSRLRIRTPAEHIPALLALAGKPLEIDGHRIRLGAPQTFALTPAASLAARLVTIKGFREPEPFLEAARRQLDALSIRGKPSIPLRRTGVHAGKPLRRILRIKDKKVVGFAMVVSELAAEESLTLQERGLGGRRHMGCGLFVPWKRLERS